MASFALSAVGRDRPGIVAAVTEALFGLNANIEDSSMTLLRGNFAIMMVLAAPDGVSAHDIDARLGPACERLGLVYSVSPVGDVPETGHPSHTLSVYGADKPGILYHVSRTLAERGVNICDLHSKLVGSAPGVWAVTLELALPGGLSSSALEAQLAGVARELGVDLTLNQIDEDLL